MESLEGMTCGVDGHEWDCLCDVKISQEIPINRIAVAGLWMGQEVADANGYHDWDNPDEVLNYLCDVLFLHDCLDFQQKYCADNPDHSGDTTFETWAVIREAVKNRMADPDANIRSVLGALGYTAEQFTSAVTMGRYVMDMETLVRFENEIMAQTRTYAHLATQFSIGRYTASNLQKYWPHRPLTNKYRGTGARPYQARMRELVKAGVQPTAVVAVIKKEFDVTISKSAVSSLKKRMRES